MERINTVRLSSKLVIALIWTILIRMAFSAFCSFAVARDVPRQVLAFYYGWYASPKFSGQWRHWSPVDAEGKQIANITDYPTFGAYDSHDPTLIERQFQIAQTAGVTGFIASWWGRGSFEDKGIPLLLTAAKARSMVISAFYEDAKGNDTESRIKSAVKDLGYIISQYGQNPAWLKVNNKPVVFIYGRAIHELTLDDWKLVLAQVHQQHPGGALFVPDSTNPAVVEVFDGVSQYAMTGFPQINGQNPKTFEPWLRIAYPRFVAMAGANKISTLTVTPGFNNHKGPTLDRLDGETYRIFWRAAIEARPDYVLIVTWNEWHEGTEIEPSLQYGTRFIDETAVFSRGFLSER